MFKLSHFYSEDMALALIVWFCSLPLIALIVVPFFGSRIALVTAILLLILVMIVCWAFVVGSLLAAKMVERHNCLLPRKNWIFTAKLPAVLFAYNLIGQKIINQGVAFSGNSGSRNFDSFTGQ